ncbi:MAG TPA: hypothetical protein VK961_01430 [Chthoniobacter sp.]|nr:hypothetical protein [Chthoniobacter sp.]
MAKFAAKYLPHLCGFWMILLLLYVAASGPVLHHIAVKKQNTTLSPWRFSRPWAPLFHPPSALPPTGSRSIAGNPYAPVESPAFLSSPEDLYTPLFDIADKTALRAPLNKYLRWWGVNALPVCGNAVMILPSRSTK